MGLFGFGFGKKRRSTKRKVSKRKAARKPPARLLRICKKYHVKATKKVGSKRVYKKVAVLKKLCLRKARALRKKLMKKHKKMMKHHKKKKVHHRRRRDAFGEEEAMSFGRRRRRAMFGENILMDDPKKYDSDKTDVNKLGMKSANATSIMKHYDASMLCPPGIYTKFGRRRAPMFGNHCKDMPMFGKRRSTTKVSKKTAMKAFRSFYKRHCAGSRRSGFGNGGNPPLNTSMGYEFCPNGMGGVLGFNSTGLFPSPCTSYNISAGAAENAVNLPTYTSSGQFGRRRRRRTSAIGSHKRRSTAVGARKRRYRKRSTAAGVKRKSAIGSRKRRSTRRI